MAESALHFHLVADISPVPDVECPVCGFDAFFTFRFWLLDEHGVTSRPSQTLCMRCRSEQRRLGSQ